MKHFIVGTMGKVGTTSLRRSINRVRGAKGYKVHKLTESSLRGTLKPNSKMSAKDAKWMVQSRRFILKNGLRGENTILVTPAREIVGRNISGFFQRLKDFGVTPSFEGVNIDELINTFKTQFNHSRPDDWFRGEYEKALGISFDDIEFDPELGYFLGQLNGVNVLLLQIEIGDEATEKLFQDEFGVPLKIRRANDSRNKPYADLIAQFKSKFVLDDELRDTLMSTKYMQKFYSERQRQHIVDFYQRKIPSLVPLPR